jgi:DNA replicative helicase MCM subunit Mcm2 (Cdc46/Mcm family)
MNQILNEKNIRNYLENEPTQFKIFDIPYDKKTKKCLDNFKVERYNTYNNYGMDNLSGLKEFLNEIGSNTEDDINIMDKTIRDLTKLVMSSYNKKYTNYWLTIRSTLPNNNFDLKRWHCDFNFLEVKDINKRTDLNKFVTVLQGPGTFFLKTTSKERKLFDSMYNEEFEKSEIRLKKNNSYLDDSSVDENSE